MTRSSEDSDPSLASGPSSFCPAVLLVDDHPAKPGALDAALDPAGAPPGPASSEHEALERVAEVDFALVLLDLRMPGLTARRRPSSFGSGTRRPLHPLFCYSPTIRTCRRSRKAYVRVASSTSRRKPSRRYAESSRRRCPRPPQIAKHTTPAPASYEEALEAAFEQQLVGIVSHTCAPFERDPSERRGGTPAVPDRLPEEAVGPSRSPKLRLAGAEADPRPPRLHSGALWRELAHQAWQASASLEPHDAGARRARVDPMRSEEFVVERAGSTRGEWDPDRRAGAHQPARRMRRPTAVVPPITRPPRRHWRARSAWRCTVGAKPVRGDGSSGNVRTSQAGSRPRAAGVSGLVSSSFARSLGSRGTVTIESTPELGTTFALELPRHA